MPQKLSFFVPVCLVLALTACGQPRAEERAIVESITVKANLNDVWNAWTTTEGIKSFFAPDAKIEAKPGGAFHVYINPLAPAGMKGADDTVFLAVQPKKMISFTWNAPPSLPEARQQRTVVVVRFVARSEALTEVSLHHSGWGEAAADNEWGKAYDYFAKAWPNVLKNLKKRFDDGPVDWKPWLERLQQQAAPTKAVGK
jgi:uncharacterized protein YndB with AHSA1/START domain